MSLNALGFYVDIFNEQLIVQWSRFASGGGGEGGGAYV